VNYMAPEQVTGDRLGPHTDVYLLGTTAYFCLSARYPFPGQAPLLARVLEDPTPLVSALPGVSAELDAVVNQALCRDPARAPRLHERLRHRAARGARGAGLTDALKPWIKPRPRRRGLGFAPQSARATSPRRSADPRRPA
jgi:serine/threonine protein kinase